MPSVSGARRRAPRSPARHPTRGARGPSGARGLRTSRRGAAIRILAGWCRLLAWAWLVWAVHAPWRELGGIVDERTRWCERAALATAVWIGLVVGDHARVRPATRLRLALWPPTVVAALATPALQLAGRPWSATIVAAAWLGYVAGVDTAAVAARLLDGHPPSEHGVS